MLRAAIPRFYDRQRLRAKRRGAPELVNQSQKLVKKKEV